MAKYVTYKCEHCDKNTFNSARVIAANYTHRTIQCEGCGHKEEQLRPRAAKKSLRYPHFNDSFDCTVESKEHEEHIAKEGGWVKHQDYQPD